MPVEAMALSIVHANIYFSKYSEYRSIMVIKNIHISEMYHK